jgi:hypothetical protein
MKICDTKQRHREALSAEAIFSLARDGFAEKRSQ